MFSSLRLRILLIITSLSVIACKNSDSWLGRAWNNTVSHYNTYFNAEQSWLSTVTTLREGYKDDYRSYIELYNYGSATALKANQGAMDAVVKKLSNIIDKHPKSKWIDDCYLLMGKSYFMKGDFFAATDIFEYVNSNFKDPIITYDARLWIFQCLYFQGKLAEAENLAVSLKNDEKFPKKLLWRLNMALGAVYLKNKKPAQAAGFIALSLKGARGKMDRYRMHFALGQAYLQLKEWTKANEQFAKVVRMNPPYDMAFNSEINRVEILSQQKNDYERANRILRRMLKDDKNIEYYGQIYYRLGINELRNKNDAKALAYLNQSLRNSKQDKSQTTTTYLALGDYWFDHKNYEQAGLYYDSANSHLDETHPDYENIAKRGTVLAELLRYLITVKQEDSLLRLAKDPVLREKTIDKLIEQEKKNAALLKSKPPSSSNPSTSSNDPNTGGTLTPSSFPFYNPASRERSTQEFQKNWGVRTNRDYWRLNAKKSPSQGSKSGSVDVDSISNADTIPAGTPEDRKKYYKDIPLTKEAQDQAEQKIEEALFNAAGVYQNSLNDAKDAINEYMELLKRFPNTKYEAQALYEIAKLSKAIGDTEQYEKYKALLEEKHPDSNYLKLLKDPNATIKVEDGSPAIERKEIEDLYEKMYNYYLTENYAEAMKVKLDADNKYAGNTLQAKFDYLYALCLIKSGQTEKGIKGLEQVASDYQGTDVATRAQENIDAYNRIKNPPAVDSASLDTAKGGDGSWKAWDGKEELFFLLVYHKGANSNLIRAGLNDFNKANFVFETLEVSSVRAFGNTVYLSVSNFSKPETAQEYMKFIMGKPEFFASKGLFEYDLAWISKTNYTTLLKNNRINSYVDFFKTDKK